MKFTKLLVLLVSLGGILFSSQTDASPSKTWNPNYSSRSLLQSLSETCNMERNVQWYGSSAPRGYRNLTSAGACCEFCQETSGCRAWVWRIIGRTCYLLDTVGNERYCFACRGGILDHEPITDANIDEVLQRCADDGRTAARAAATAACLELTNTCLPAGPDDEPRAEMAIAGSQESLEDVVQRSCESVFSQTCRTEAFNRASEVNPACAAILNRGPGGPTRDCEGQNEARRIFNDQITELCAPSD